MVAGGMVVAGHPRYLTWTCEAEPRGQIKRRRAGGVEPGKFSFHNGRLRDGTTDELEIAGVYELISTSRTRLTDMRCRRGIVGERRGQRNTGEFWRMDWPVEEGRRGTPNGWRGGREKVEGRCEEIICPP